MNKPLQGAAKRLILSLLTLSALGGCAVYAPPPEPYAYGQPVYGAPLVYAPPPVYVAPPLFFNFGFRHGGRGGHHGGGHRGGGHR